MVKVTNPLGGTEAHGRIGQSIIFQGTTAKAYRAPVIQKTQAQFDAEDRFQSCTKMIGAMKAWSRGALSAMLGTRWYQMIYQEISNYWADAEISFNAFGTTYKDAWRTNAPFQNTKLDAGLTFYACAYAILQLETLNSYEFFGMAPPQATNSLAVKALWEQSLDNVFLAGVYDDTNADIHFLGGSPYWVSSSNVNALNGSFMLSQTTGLPIATFDFFGSQFGILYHQAVLQGSALVEVDVVNNWTFSQNDPAGLWQVEWLSPIFNHGLHRVSVARTGADGSINIDGIKVYG